MLVLLYSCTAGITTVNSSLLSVNDELSSQEIQVNCYTFRVKPNQVTWIIDSALIKPESSYQPVNGSELLDSGNQNYQHYITLTGSFINGTSISCSVNVNEEIQRQVYVLKGKEISITIFDYVQLFIFPILTSIAASSPPNGLSATILSASSVFINWIPSPDVNGYILHFIPDGQSKIVEGGNKSSDTLKGLAQGVSYKFFIYSYNDLPSESSNNISFTLNGRWIILFLKILFTTNFKKKIIEL